MLPHTAQQNAVDTIVYAWMQCQDCLSRERDRVMLLGDSAVPRLRDILINGPPPSHMESIQKSLQYLVSHADSGRVPSNTVVAAQLEAFRTMYRIRAASALAGISNASAVSALCAGVAPSAPGSTPQVAASARVAELGGSCP
ncbi:MAG: hypothetical protein IPP90_16165 [Gemmatimonadaceae bacterium]|nr:hypothetical protein [Gemmatimonadaceae bacterium]